MFSSIICGLVIISSLNVGRGRVLEVAGIWRRRWQKDGTIEVCVLWESKRKAVSIYIMRSGRMCEFHLGGVETSEGSLLLPVHALAQGREICWSVCT